MRKKLLTTSLAALILLSGVTTWKMVSAEDESKIISSPKWGGDVMIKSPEWFKEQVKSDMGPAKSEKINNQYNFVHKNGKSISKEEISTLIEGNISFEPDENNKKSNLVAVGYYTVNGENQIDYYFSNIDDTPIKDIKRYAVDVATQIYNETDAFNRKKSTGMGTK